jgi:hypothetical protein
MTIDDMYSTTKNIITDADLDTVFVHKPIFERIAKILDDDTPNITDEEWQQILKLQDGYTCYAILDSPKAPSYVKEQAINIMAKRTTPESLSTKLFIPFIFNGNKEVMKNLSFEISEKIVSGINWDRFSHELRSYINKKPDIKYLPFAGTDIEKLLLKKLISGKVLTKDTEKIYEYYKLIEYYSDEKSFKNIIGNVYNDKPLISTAIINNKHFSTKYKEDIFTVSDISFNHINSNFNIEIMKEIYNSIICSLEYNNSNNDISIILKCLDSINQLIKHQLLPQSCELDFAKKYFNEEIRIKMISMEEFFKKTKNEEVLIEALKSNKTHAISLASLNSYTPKSDKIVALAECLKSLDTVNAKTKWHEMADSEKKNFFIGCIMEDLPNDFYNKMLKHMKPNGFCEFELKEKMALNPETPIEVLETLKISGKSDKIQAFIYINEKCRELFDKETARKVLDTFYVIADVTTIINGKLVLSDPFTTQPSDFFLPDISTTDNQNLVKFLTNIIEKNDIELKVLKTILIEYAKEYLKLLNKNNIIQESEKIVQSGLTNLPDNISCELLQGMKQYIQDKLLLKKNRRVDIQGDMTIQRNLGLTHNFYDMYMVYAEGIRYAELYKEISTIKSHEEQFQILHSNKMDMDETCIEK